METRAVRVRSWVPIAVIATGVTLAAIGWASGLIGGSQKDDGSARAEQSAPAARDDDRYAANAPPSATIEDCNRYAADAQRDGKRVVGDAVAGGAIGAAVGAASGAIAGGHDGPKKGAGIGALVGATAGTLHGLSEENKRSEAARAAYAECMAGRGFPS